MSVFDNIVQDSVNEIAIESQFQRTIGQKIKEANKEISSFGKNFKKAIADKNEKECLRLLSESKHALIELRESIRDLDVKYDTKDKVLDNMKGIFKIIVGFIIGCVNVFKHIVPTTNGEALAQAVARAVQAYVGGVIAGFGILDLLKEKDPEVIKGGLIKALNVQIDALTEAHKRIKDYGVSHAYA